MDQMERDIVKCHFYNEFHKSKRDGLRTNPQKYHEDCSRYVENEMRKLTPERIKQILDSQPEPVDKKNIISRLIGRG